MPKMMPWRRLLIFGLALLMSACARPSFDGEDTRRGPLVGDITDPEYRQNSCAYGFMDGPRPARLALPSRQLVTSSFDKRFDRSRLNAVAELSPEATARLMSLDGLAVFHVPLRVSGGCAMFESLPEAPAILQSLWAATGLRGLLGLFLPRDRVTALGLDSPVIVVRADTDRYTLVHEYMHHVYNEVRENTGYSDQGLMRQLEDRQRRFKAVTPFSREDGDDPQRVTQVTDAWIDLSESMIELSENFALEEMAIEAELTAATLNGRLSRVSSYNRRNSVQYILTSWGRAREQLGGISQDASLLVDLLRRHDDGERLRKVKAVEARAQTRLNQGRAIVESTVPASVRMPVAAGFERQTHDHENCGREALLKSWGMGDLRMPRLR